jgi:hypothetical protein
VKGAGGVSEAFMVVRIRFPKGSRVEQRAGKNAHIAAMAGGIMTMASVACLMLAAWRLTADLNWTDEFFIRTGLLSHWQIWLALTIATSTASVRLWRYIRVMEAMERDLPEPETVKEAPPVSGKAASR